MRHYTITIWAFTPSMSLVNIMTRVTQLFVIAFAGKHAGSDFYDHFYGENRATLTLSQRDQISRRNLRANSCLRE